MSENESYAAEIIAGLRELCKERQAITGSVYLTEGEYASIDNALAQLGYTGSGYSAAGAREWAGSLRRCLFGP